MAGKKGTKKKVVEETVSDEKAEEVKENGSTEDEKPAENGDDVKQDSTEDKATKKEDKDEDENGDDAKQDSTEDKATKKDDDDDDDDDGGSSEEDLGSLEKPLIVTTKRERKGIEVYGDKKGDEKKEGLDYSKGKGIKLADIPIVNHNIGRADTEDLHVLHRIMYRTNGKKHNTKKNIREFCGWPFDKDSKEYKNVTTNTIDRLILPALKWTCNLLGLEKSKDKDAMNDALCEFLLEPVQYDEEVPEKRKSEGGSKRRSSGKKSAPKRKSKSTPKSKPKKKSKDSDDDEENNKVSDVSEVSDDSGSGSEEEEEEEKPKKKTPQAKKSPKKKAKATPVKIAIPAKKSKSASKKRKPKASDDTSEDEEPLAKKSNVPPTDAELKKVVSAILADADLEQVTMKSVVRQVYDKYSSFDLTSRKDFLKKTVKVLIS